MKMNYFVVGTNDMTVATQFYDQLFDGAGLACLPASDRMTYWLGDGFAFAVALPFNEAHATHGNGTMIGFCVGGAPDVQQYHARATALGGTCEGAPRQRGPKYSAYARDPDGNKLCFSD